MNCQKGNGETKRFGKDRKGEQRYRCLSCKVTFNDPDIKRVDGMLVSEDKENHHAHLAFHFAYYNSVRCIQY